MRRMLTSAAVVPLALVALTGCGIDQSLLSAVACADWVVFDSDDERFAAADAVVVATDIEPDGTVGILGYDANAYRVRVVESEKGDLVADDVVRVGSMADGCASPPYGDGDDMLDGQTLRLYLDHVEGQWQTITPFDGVQVVE